MGQATNQIATEAEALSISGLSNWGLTADSELCVTKARAEELGCVVDTSEIDYTDDQCVEYDDLSKDNAVIRYKSSDNNTPCINDLIYSYSELYDNNPYGEGVNILSHTYNSNTQIGIIKFDNIPLIIPILYLSDGRTSTLTQISIPDGVKYIDNNAVSRNGCYILDIPNSVRQLGSCEYMLNLQTVILGDDLQFVGNVNASHRDNNTVDSCSIFCYCPQLLHISFRNRQGTGLNDGRDNGGHNVIYDYSALKVIDGCANSICPLDAKVIGYLAYANRQVTSLALSIQPSSSVLETIESSAFYNCTKFDTADWPATLKTIESSAFSGCTALTNCKFGVVTTNAYNLSAIGDNAFEGCTKLSAIYLPNKTLAIGKKVFKSCTGISNVYGCKMATCTPGTYISQTKGYAPDFLDDTSWYTSQTGMCIIPNDTASTTGTLYKLKDTSLGTNVTISDKVVNILNGALLPATNLTAVSFPHTTCPQFDGTSLGSHIKNIYVQWSLVSAYRSKLTEDASKIHPYGSIGIHMYTTPYTSYYAGTCGINGATAKNVSQAMTPSSTAEATVEARSTLTLKFTNVKFRSVLKNPIQVWIGNANSWPIQVGTVTQTLQSTGGSGVTSSTYSGSISFIPANYIDPTTTTYTSTNGIYQVYIKIVIPTT